MTLDELVDMMEALVKEDQRSPEVFKPIVAIGHTKDLVDFETIELFLSYLRAKEVPVSTLEGVSERCRPTLI